MKYHIDTIPLWDSINIDSECPLCVLNRHIELSQADKLLGASVMDPDTRIHVNEHGFCKAHQKLLIGGNNRLGLGLMMQSHTQNIKPKILHILNNCKKIVAQKRPLRFTKNADISNKLSEYSKNLSNISNACLLCDNISKIMTRYYENFVILWQKDMKFREAFKNSKGLCLEHLSTIIPIAGKKLSSKDAEEFFTVLYDLFEKNITRQEQELDTFCRKWDYRNADMPWGNSKDAVERIINRLQGFCVGQEPHPDDRNKSRKF